MRRLGTALVAVTAAATLVVALGAFQIGGLASAQSAKPTKLDFAGSVTWYGQVPIMVAVDKGFFKEQGIDVGYQVVLASSDRLRALTAGSVAFTNLGRLAVIAEMARGNDSFYYFANIDDSPGNEGCYARAGFASFPALKGKKIAANTSAEMLMHELLQVNGMSVKDIQFVNLPPNEMAGALAKGDVDAACVWEPLLGQMIKAVPDGKLLGKDLDTDMYKRFQTASAPDIVVISRKLVDEHPDQARKLAAAMFKGVELVNRNPEEAARTVAHYFKKTPEETLVGIKGFRYFGLADQPEHMKRHEEQMQYLAKWLFENKKIPALPDTRKWANSTFLPKP
jgi:NitT/TauT family transport system substrate-binding protein